MSTFGKYPSWIRPKLKGQFTSITALVELVCLMNHKTNRVRISHERLGERMGCSTRTAQRAIEVLVKEGVILRDRTNYSSNVYTVLYEEESMEDWDEWETLGEDIDVPKAEKKVVKGRVPRLVTFFSDEMALHQPMSIQSAVNAKALGKHFKEMMDDHGVTEQQIKTMITLFALDVDRGNKSVTDEYPAWQMFLADRQALLKRVKEGTEDIVYIDEMPPAD